MSKEELAVSYKHSGCNCCQAVLMAFAEEMGLSEDMLKRLGVTFGSGMGGTEGDCGALVGAEMALGIMEYAGIPMHGRTDVPRCSFQTSGTKPERRCARS